MNPRIIDNHIVFTHPDPAHILAIAPGTKRALARGVEILATPFTLDHAILLRNFGLDVPSPIRTAYRWEGIYTPRWYQIATAEQMTMNKRFFCLNAQRTGKTLSTLWAADYLKKLGKIRKVLIVAPLSTLERVWADNLFMHFPRRKFVVLHGASAKRKDLLATDADFYIINHHGVATIHQELKNRNDFDLVVIDEVACFRNSQTKLWKTLRTLITPERWVWGLTGTPTSQAPTDAYGIAKLIKPENVPMHFTAFKQLTMQQFGPFRWVPRTGSEDTVARVLAPSIRFDRTVCTNMEPCLIERTCELSPEQKKHFTALMREAVTEIKGSTVTAVNAAVLVSKLVQATCIAENTLVLSSLGWVPIQDITRLDTLWDGHEWVGSEGAIYKGQHPTINCGGVWMTPDHKVLSKQGWVSAEEFNYGLPTKRFTWGNVRLPYGYSEGGDYNRRTEVRPLAVPLYLRERSRAQEPEPQSEASPQPKTLRLQGSGAAQNARNVAHPAVSYMDPYGTPMLRTQTQGFQSVWGAGYNCLRGMAQQFCSFLGRHAARVRPALIAGAYRQRRPLFPEKLSLGNAERASKQQKVQCVRRNAVGAYDGSEGRGDLQPAEQYTSRQNIPLRVGGGERTADPHRREAVFDIINCGPRNQFIVKSEGGTPRIVHNCGVIYGSDGKTVEIDFGPRLAVLEELIEENENKVIVFVPFTGVLDAIARELRKKWTVEVVDGGVSAGARNKIFHAFQAEKNPHIIVAHPATMAHGLDLTAADLIIWYAPHNSNEQYLQACARIDGSRQKSKIDIAHIYATRLERRAFENLRQKGNWQRVLLDLVKGE